MTNKYCYICRFDFIDGFCEAKDREWHAEAKKDMDEKINKIKGKKADQYFTQLLF